MRYMLLRAGVAGMAATFALGIGVGPAQATAAPTPSKPDASISAPTAATWTSARRAGGAAVANQAGEYWTRERMRKAVAANERASNEGASNEGASNAKRHGSTPPAAAASAMGLASPAASATVGRVFFYDPFLRKDDSCSASTVRSTSKQLVITAGHCVHTGRGGGFLQNWVFVPLYNSGSRPHGTWSAKWFQPFNEWKNNSDLTRDVAFVTVWPNAAGQKIVDVVDGNTLTWNQPYEQFLTILAYPAKPPFDGMWQRFCQRTTFRPGTWPFQENKIAMTCNFTGGASGGPWLRNYNGRVGEVNGVMSTQNGEGVSKSAYFDGAVHNLYLTMAALT